MEKTRILFVCLGNICRSPGAEAIMKSIVNKAAADSRFEIDSAGIINYHQGKPADHRMIEHARNRGYNLTSVSRPVNPRVDFKTFDLIVGMDNQNIRDLQYLAPDEKSREKIVKITNFCKKGGFSEVPDPYHGGPAGFELVLDILEDACQGLYLYLSGKNSRES